MSLPLGREWAPVAPGGSELSRQDLSTAGIDSVAVPGALPHTP